VSNIGASRPGSGRTHAALAKKWVLRGLGQRTGKGKKKLTEPSEASIRGGGSQAEEGKRRKPERVADPITTIVEGGGRVEKTNHLERKKTTRGGGRRGK